jgi:hypothetical protein
LSLKIIHGPSGVGAREPPDEVARKRERVGIEARDRWVDRRHVDRVVDRDPEVNCATRMTSSPSYFVGCEPLMRQANPVDPHGAFDEPPFDHDHGATSGLFPEGKAASRQLRSR